MSLREIPAQKLVGLVLKNGWKVTSKYVRTDGLSSGKYSVGYFVERDGEKGFLKAIDYSRAVVTCRGKLTCKYSRHRFNRTFR
jgi:hypothetical protein